jgi:hypothetical protein
VVAWLEPVAGWRLAAELEDEPVDELAEDDVESDALDVAALDAVPATVVVVEPLLVEDSPPCESSRPAVSAIAPATLAAAAIRRPLQAGWGRCRRATMAAGEGGGGGGGALGGGASMGAPIVMPVVRPDAHDRALPSSENPGRRP